MRVCKRRGWVAATRPIMNTTRTRAMDVPEEPLHSTSRPRAPGTASRYDLASSTTSRGSHTTTCRRPPCLAHRSIDMAGVRFAAQGTVIGAPILSRDKYLALKAFLRGGRSDSTGASIMVYQKNKYWHCNLLWAVWHFKDTFNRIYHGL